MSLKRCIMCQGAVPDHSGLLEGCCSTTCAEALLDSHRAAPRKRSRKEIMLEEKQKRLGWEQPSLLAYSPEEPNKKRSKRREKASAE